MHDQKFWSNFVQFSNLKRAAGYIFWGEFFFKWISEFFILKQNEIIIWNLGRYLVNMLTQRMS